MGKGHGGSYDRIGYQAMIYIRYMYLVKGDYSRKISYFHREQAYCEGEACTQDKDDESTRRKIAV